MMSIWLLKDLFHFLPEHIKSLCFTFSLCDLLLQTLSQATGARIKRAFDRHGVVPPSSEQEENHQNRHHPQQQRQHLAEFQTCPVCLLMTPPRSHHCKICNCCVLKRDHHCFFTASCVGFNNQRYFVVFMFYMSVSCAAGTLLLAHHLRSGKSDFVADTSFTVDVRLFLSVLDKELLCRFIYFPLDAVIFIGLGGCLCSFSTFVTNNLILIPSQVS